MGWVDTDLEPTLGVSYPAHSHCSYKEMKSVHQEVPHKAPLMVTKPIKYIRILRQKLEIITRAD
jgi:hypothetical protein